MAESGAGPGGDMVLAGDPVGHIGVSSLAHCWVTVPLCGSVGPLTCGHT